MGTSRTYWHLARSIWWRWREGGSHHHWTNCFETWNDKTKKNQETISTNTSWDLTCGWSWSTNKLKYRLAISSWAGKSAIVRYCSMIFSFRYSHSLVCWIFPMIFNFPNQTSIFRADFPMDFLMDFRQAAPRTSTPSAEKRRPAAEKVEKVEARRSKSLGPQLWMNNGLPSGQQT